VEKNNDTHTGTGKIVADIVKEIVEIVADENIRSYMLKPPQLVTPGGREDNVETSAEMEIDAGSTKHDRNCVCEKCRASRAEKSDIGVETY
jgi:hypothetical protein